MRTYDTLRRDERVTLALRALYERGGYRRFRMDRFEEYDFYAVNREFLADSRILSFTDLDGRLLALRPDVTLSIVKQTEAEPDGAQRLYYTESVFRPARGAASYRETFQVGVEYIGRVTPYASVEMVTLAARSLACVGGDYALDVSHTRFLEGALRCLPEDEGLRRAARGCLARKNAHELAAVVGGVLGEEETGRLCRLARLSGDFVPTLEQARALSVNEEMHAAVEELDALYRALRACGQADGLSLDVSVDNNETYYDGLILRGYIRGVSGAVLSGGRYDPLLRRMGKPGLSGLGFAIYFDELARYLSAPAREEVDVLLLYDEDADPAAVAREAQACADGGERVWAAPSEPAGLAYGRVVRVRGEGARTHA